VRHLEVRQKSLEGPLAVVMFGQPQDRRGMHGDERPALKVSLISRLLANEYHPGADISFAENRLRGITVHVASLAVLDGATKQRHARVRFNRQIGARVEIFGPVGLPPWRLWEMAKWPSLLLELTFECQRMALSCDLRGPLFGMPGFWHDSHLFRE